MDIDTAQLTQICLLLLYFLPTFIAGRREHRQLGPIAAVNILLGWTFIGWVVAFAWAVSPTDQKGKKPA